MKGMSLPPEHRLLLRGTLYPVVIESTSFRGPATAIKSHHNAGGLPSRMKRALLEPRRRLFKGEVRAIFRELDLPRDSVRRRPFTRYGLGLRILGQGKAQSAVPLRAATGSYKGCMLKQVHRAVGKRVRHFLVGTGRLFKDEVRAIFRELDLPRDSAWRRPAPRYGLGVRILGEGKAQSAATLRAATGSYKDYGLKQVHRAIGKRDRHFLVDTGRLSELAGAADPGAKRKIRGRLVIKGIGHAVKDTDLQPEPRPLLQGTLYPVGIESTSFGGSSTAIKSSQDLGTLPSRMKRARREPRRRLFEDEVRAIFGELATRRGSTLSPGTASASASSAR